MPVVRDQGLGAPGTVPDGPRSSSLNALLTEEAGRSRAVRAALPGTATLPLGSGEER